MAGPLWTGVRRALLACALAVLAACGGSGGGGTAASASVAAADGAIVARASLANGSGTVMLAADGRAYWAPAGSSNESTAGLQPVYDGSEPITGLTAVADGVLVQFGDGRVWLSPDGFNLAGGGRTLLAYGGGTPIRQITAFRSGVLTWFDNGTIYYSANGLDLGGGGATVLAYAGARAVSALRVTVDGVQTQLSNGDIYRSTDGLNLGGGGSTLQLPAWVTQTSSAAFGPRDSARAVHFNDRRWLSGGFFRSGPDTSYFDLWSTAGDAQPWTLAFGDSKPETGLRSDFYDPYSPVVAFQGELWAVGATTWSSSDGTHWVQRSTAGPRRAREDAQVLVLGDELVFIDPQSASVSISTDGSHWSDAATIPGFAPRCGAVIQRLPAGPIVIAGGGDCAYGGFFTDVWTSDDGRNWQQATDGAGQPAELPWTGRMWPCAATSPTGVIWMIGGYRIDKGVGVNLADVWYSRDGVNWRELEVRSGSSAPRHGASCIHDASAPTLHMVAGKGGVNGLNDNASVLNDVLRLHLPTDDFLP